MSIPMLAEPLLTVRDLHTSYFTRDGEVHAVNGVNLEIRPGEVLGLVGESGSGKSTTVWSIMNLVPPPGRIVSGQVEYRGQDLLRMDQRALRELRGKELALIVPNARSYLNPLVPAGVQLANAVLAHTTQREARHQAPRRAVAMMSTVGIPDPERRAHAYPHELSGGMAQRIVIGMALTHSPTLLIADEATFGLDVTIQAQVLETFRTLIAESSAAALLVTRDLGIVAHYCDRAAVMYGGEIVEEASVPDLFANPSHPYTQKLLAAVRYEKAAPTAAELSLTTSSFNPLLPPAHCFFYDRCPRRMEVCRRDHPQALEIGPEHRVRCRLYDEWSGDG